MISPDDWLSITFRLSLALFVGAVIGWNRQRAGKPAGLRTHMLVSFGAALFVLVPLQMGSPQQGSDLSRAIQGIATGVGFLGAGEIVHQSHSDTRKARIRGLTSAAAIWVSAALGITAGCGLWPMGLIGALLALLILSIVKKLERHVPIQQEPEE